MEPFCNVNILQCCHGNGEERCTFCLKNSLPFPCRNTPVHTLAPIPIPFHIHVTLNCVQCPQFSSRFLSHVFGLSPYFAALATSVHRRIADLGRTDALSCWSVTWCGSVGPVPEGQKHFTGGNVWRWCSPYNIHIQQGHWSRFACLFQSSLYGLAQSQSLARIQWPSPTTLTLTHNRMFIIGLDSINMLL